MIRDVFDCVVRFCVCDYVIVVWSSPVLFQLWVGIVMLCDEMFSVVDVHWFAIVYCLVFVVCD